MEKDMIKDVTGICFETLCRALLGLLLLVLLVGIAFGVTRSALDLWTMSGHLFSGDGLHEALNELVVNVLMVLALVVALMGVRIMAIRFSPKRRELLDGL